MARDKSGGCDTGMACFVTKAEAEAAGTGVAKRCGRCRQWHNQPAKKGRGRGGGKTGRGTVEVQTSKRKRQRPSRGR